jgi:hypothetical protein
VLNGSEQRLCIGMAAPTAWIVTFNQLLPNVGMIVDFSVVDDDKPPAVRVHRLISSGRQVNDCKAVMGKCDPGREIQPQP